MAEKLEDLKLPQATVLKIIKEAIPENVNIGKDVKAALATAASMFILYITSHSTQIIEKANRKTLNAKDIFDALKEAEFAHFIPPLEESLKEFKAKGNKKKDNDEDDAEIEDDDADKEEET